MYKTFSEVKVALSAGKSVESIVHSYLEQIEKNKDLNAFLEVFTESALDQARLVDQKLTSGKAGRLAGMVIGLKALS